MVDLQPYRVVWQSLIQREHVAYTAKFDTQSEAEAFAIKIDFARNREVLHCNFPRGKRHG